MNIQKSKLFNYAKKIQKIANSNFNSYSDIFDMDASNMI